MARIFTISPIENNPQTTVVIFAVAQIAITEATPATIKIFAHNLLQYSHVCSFFEDVFVLNPYMEFIFAFDVVSRIIPATIKTTGKMKKASLITAPPHPASIALCVNYIDNNNPHLCNKSSISYRLTFCSLILARKRFFVNICYTLMRAICIHVCIYPFPNLQGSAPETPFCTIF